MNYHHTTVILEADSEAPEARLIRRLTDRRPIGVVRIDSALTIQADDPALLDTLADECRNAASLLYAAQDENDAA